MAANKERREQGAAQTERRDVRDLLTRGVNKVLDEQLAPYASRSLADGYHIPLSIPIRPGVNGNVVRVLFRPDYIEIVKNKILAVLHKKCTIYNDFFIKKNTEAFERFNLTVIITDIIYVPDKDKDPENPTESDLRNFLRQDSADFINVINDKYRNGWSEAEKRRRAEGVMSVLEMPVSLPVLGTLAEAIAPDSGASSDERTDTKKAEFPVSKILLAKSHVDLPEEAPALWRKDRLPKDTPVTFIRRHYEPWLEKGLILSHIRHFDFALYKALGVWRHRHPADVDGLGLAKQSEITDEQIDAARRAGLLGDNPGDDAQALARAAGVLRYRDKKGSRIR